MVNEGKLLIYRRGGLGDTLLTFPIAEIFKRKGYTVLFAGNTDYLPLGKEAGFIDRYFSDIKMPPSAGLNLESYSKIILFSKENFLNHPRAEVVNPLPPKGVHALRHYLKSLNLSGEHFSAELPLEGKTDWDGFLIIHPGSGSKLKNAPSGLFKELYHRAGELGLKPLVVLGVAEEHLSGYFDNFDTYRVEDILEFAKLLKGAAVFVGNDSGFSHLAGYLGVPTLALFGPTDPVQWRPIGRRVSVLYKGLTCSPCFPKGCKNRLYKECLSFSLERVMEALRGLLL